MSQKNKYDVTITVNLIVEVDHRYDETDPEFDLAVKTEFINSTTYRSIKDMITHVEEIPNPEKMNNHE